MNPVEQGQAQQQKVLNETLLLNGQHQSSSTHQSIIFYGIVKGGFTYVSAFLRQLEANFSVAREDLNSHKRQVQPGYHKRKLKPETIEILNDRFAEILETLGYDRD